MKLIEVYKKLALIDFDTDISSRELIKEGKVIKIAARDGKRQDRYLYLVRNFPCFYKLAKKYKSRIDLTVVHIPPEKLNFTLNCLQ